MRAGEGGGREEGRRKKGGKGNVGEASVTSHPTCVRVCAVKDRAEREMSGETKGRRDLVGSLRKEEERGAHDW
jgi:hypothetical protein